MMYYKQNVTTKLTNEQVGLLHRALIAVNTNWFNSVEMHELGKIKDLVERAFAIRITI